MRAPFRIGEHRGYRYADLPKRIAEGLESWLTSGEVQGGECWKRGRIYRVETWAVKFYGPPRSSWERWRPSPAIRAAERARKLRAAQAPRPLLALASRSAPVRGLLVSEWIEGRSLARLWDGGDAAPRAAFADFLAALVRAGVLLGDFHLDNALWDGRAWVLLDLEALRHGLHRVNRRALIERAWARAWLGVERAPELEPLYRRFHAAAGLRGDPARWWAGVVARAEAWRPAAVETPA